MIRYGTRATSVALALSLALGCGDSSGEGGAGASSSDGGAGGSVASTGGGGSTGDGGNPSTGGAGGEGASGGEGGAASVPFTSLGTSTYEAQTSIATDTAGTILVVWRATFADSNTTSVGFSVSHDAGNIWSEPSYLDAPGGRIAVNPVVAVDSHGLFTVAFIGLQVSGDPDEHVYAARFDASSDTFDDVHIASDDGTDTTLVFDALSIAVDTNDDVLLTWADFSTDQPALEFARTSDAIAFDRSIIVDDVSFGNLAFLCLDPEGPADQPLFVVHLGAAKTLTLRRSDDGGQTWQLGASLAAADVVFQDPTCAVGGGKVFITYGAGIADFSFTDESPADAIDLLYSNDGGDSFFPPAIVLSEPPSQYLYPRIARGPDGHLEITYYEGVVDSDATFARASSDNGITWTESPIVPAGTLTTDLGLASWLGGYTGIAVGRGSGFVSYTENTQGVTHVGFAEIALP